MERPRDSVDVSRVSDEVAMPDRGGPVPDIPENERQGGIDRVLQSDVAITTLLQRLKQSVSSARDFAAFLKERSTFEEKHAQALRKLSRTSHDMARRPENRQGSFATNYEELTRVHDRMAEFGLQFANAIFSMSDELLDLAGNGERGRKHWKQNGLAAEKRVSDTEAIMDKAKSNYYSLAEKYDRIRTGERQGKGLSLKNKSQAQQEEDAQRRVEAADQDYAAKVQAAQGARQELQTSMRPQAVHALQDLITEIDAGLSLQLQKYAMLNEKLLLSNGLCVSPLKAEAEGGQQAKSLRDIAQSIDNRKDLQDYILSFSGRGGPHREIKYEKHPVLAMARQQQPQPQFQPQPQMQSQPQQPSQPPVQAFNATAPQFGSPDRSNTGFGQYDQGQRPPQPGQMTGVTPYQNQGPNRDGLPIPGQHPQYPTGPHSQMPNYGQGQAPQIHPPQMSGAGSFNTPGRPDMVSPIGSDNARPFNDVNRPPQQQPFASQGDRMLSPVSSVSSQPPLLGPARAGTAPYPVDGLMGNRQSGGAYSGDDRGPQSAAMSNQNNNRGPPSGQGPDYRGAPPQTNGNFQGPGGPNPDNRNLPSQTNGTYRAQGTPNVPPAPAGPVGGQIPNQRNAQRSNLPPNKPVFNISLDELFRRDNSAVPTIVYQCVQAVDLFGLDTEGIYRTSGSAPHIMEMKQLFDHDATQVDFRNPAAFHHDIASVCTLLKHFLRDLPDPLLTSAQYNSFIEAAKLEDDTVRRDSLHAIINSLPDPNYATLRVLTLHLHRVAQHSSRNRMTPSNLAIVFGPTWMSGGQAGDVRDAAWQAKVVETIINNTFQVFDDDE